MLTHSINENEVACPADTEAIFVTAGQYSGVKTWSLSSRQHIASFAAPYEGFGGRLAVLDRGLPTVVVASWTQQHLNAYELDGTPRWERTDISQIQHIEPVFGGDLAVARAKGDCQLISSETGQTQHVLSGIEQLRGTLDRPQAFWLDQRRGRD